MNAQYPWLESVLDHVEQSAESGRLPHALLVDLPSGWGVETLLGRITASLLGLPGGYADPEHAHADLHWLKVDDGEIKVDDIRRLNTWAANRPSGGRCKVGIIQDAHRLNVNAANALLKTLEEPPPDTYLLVQTEHPARLLATIRSRCQRLPFTPSTQVAEAWLESEAPAALAYLNEAGGGPLDALALSEGGSVSVDEGLRSLLDPKTRDKQIKVLQEDDLPDWLGRWYRKIVLRVAEKPKESATLLEFADELLNVRRQLLSSNSANARLLLERLLFRWQRL